MKIVIHKIIDIAVSATANQDDNEDDEVGQETRFYAILNATLYSKSKSAFFGRTYKTKPIELESTGGDTYSTVNFHCMYFYSKLVNPKDAVLVLELEFKGKKKFSILDEKSIQSGLK